MKPLSMKTLISLHYFNSLLEKTASEAVQVLSLTTANYEEATAFLKSRFGNKQMIISKHMESLLNMAPVSSNHDLKGSASALMSTSQTSTTCTYCKQPHASNKCKTVTDVQKRKEMLRKEGRCYVCLKKHHLSCDCPSQNKSLMQWVASY